MKIVSSLITVFTNVINKIKLRHTAAGLIEDLNVH